MLGVLLIVPDVLDTTAGEPLFQLLESLSCLNTSDLSIFITSSRVETSSRPSALTGIFPFKRMPGYDRRPRGGLDTRKHDGGA